jgi:hypothetical protein
MPQPTETSPELSLASEILPEVWARDLAALERVQDQEAAQAVTHLAAETLLLAGAA